MVVGRLIRALDRPVDAASVAAFRVLFGVLMLLSTLRFFGRGWVAEEYGKPRLFFQYWGFGWIHPFSVSGMYALYSLIAVAASCVLLGVWYGPAACVFALAFSYAHLCDKSNYLNHYYLVSLLACLLVLLPLDREYSWRVWRMPSARRAQVRAWVLYLLRFQIGVVYVFGGIGKLGSDWLIYGEPLRLWLAMGAELPLLGPLLVRPWSGLVFSWAGALFDLSIVPLLSWRVTRAPACVTLVVFHVLTALLFQIGMFPWIMIVSATLFWDPGWPRTLLERSSGVHRPVHGVAGAPLSALGRALAALYAAYQILMPLRSLLYPGNTLWSEEGFRFSWKVMLIEKLGTLDFHVVDAAGRTYTVSASDYLTPFQARMTATQPDMILDLAHVVARDFESKGHGQVHVYADSQVTFNGRRHHRFIDPQRDLTQEVDSLRHKTFILPAPAEPPPL
jgi:hypothetical protein